MFDAHLQICRCLSAKDSLDCLRQVDVNILQQVNTNIANSGFFGTHIFVPVVDGHLIPRRPTEILREESVNGVCDHVFSSC